MVDVCLVLEGTYPYVAGGVSSWVHQLISQMPGIEFGIIHLGSHPSAPREPKYAIPPNVRFIQDVFLHDYSQARRRSLLPFGRRRKLTPADQLLRERLSGWDYDYFRDHLRFLTEGSNPLPPLSEAAFGRTTWNNLVRLYRHWCTDQSFIDFFWTWRFTNLPVYRLMLADVPAARLYHTVSTGYAGFLATLAKLRHDSSLLLTEHGIYTKERKIEVQSAEWIYESAALLELQEKRHWFRRWWITLFEFLGTVCYDHCDQIITLYEGNREMQHRHGADPRRTRVIPNGILPDRYREALALVRARRVQQQNLPEAQERGRGLTVGFIGRIVPIKDVKTLLRSWQEVTQELPAAKLYLLGPTDEDPGYFAECQQLCGLLGIDRQVEFTGSVDVRAWLPQLDLLVLSSISEGQPLVILEGHAAALPVVSTDVGSCSELLYGGTHPGDAELGHSGIIVPLASPTALAQAQLRLLRDPALRTEMGEAGLRRVEGHYRQDVLLARYEQIYRELQVHM